jgi:hypothetical protein
MQVRSDQPIEYLDQMTWDRVEFHPFAIGGSEGIVSLYEATENWGHTILEYRSPIEVNRWKVRHFGERLAACQDGPTHFLALHERALAPSTSYTGNNGAAFGTHNPQWRAFER